MSQAPDPETGGPDFNTLLAELTTLMHSEPFLAQVADLDSRARKAGLPGVLPERCYIWSPTGKLSVEFWWLMASRARVDPVVAEAACREWLREWCRNQTQGEWSALVDMWSSDGLIEWANRILDRRGKNP